MKTSWKWCGFRLSAIDSFDFTRKIVKKSSSKNSWKRWVFVKIEFLDKNWRFETVCVRLEYSKKGHAYELEAMHTEVYKLSSLFWYLGFLFGLLPISLFYKASFKRQKRFYVITELVIVVRDKSWGFNVKSWSVIIDFLREFWSSYLISLTLPRMVVRSSSSVGIFFDRASTRAVWFFSELTIIKLHGWIPFSRRIFYVSIATSNSKTPPFASFAPNDKASFRDPIVRVVIRRFYNGRSIFIKFCAKLPKRIVKLKWDLSIMLS